MSDNLDDLFDEPFLGVITRCECGAESPATIPIDADLWEDDHTQWDCPISTAPVWDDVIETWRYRDPRVFTRRDAPITPPADSPAVPPRRRQRTPLQRDIIARRLFGDRL